MHRSTQHIWHLLIFGLFVALLSVHSRNALAQKEPVVSAAKIDHSVLSTLSSLYGTTSTIETHLDLTTPFKTSAQWTLVIADEVDNPKYDHDSSGNSVASICFVKIDAVDCSEKIAIEKYRQQGMQIEDRVFYQYYVKIVYLDSKKQRPLLLVGTCSYARWDGDCGQATFLYDYVRNPNDFRLVFFNLTGKNNNQETRFIEDGPLMGSVIAVYPTEDAPYGYFVEVYKPDTFGNYKLVLRYRGETRYNDGNGLPVIDSEMAGILRRLDLWKPGDALPKPAKMPSDCKRLLLSHGEEWCD